MVKKQFKFTPAVIVLIALLTLFVGLPAAYADQEVGMQLKGKVLKTNPAPFMDSNRVMVPVREIASALGADVSWDEKQQAVNVAQGENKLTVLIGQQQARMNEKDVQMEAVPVIVDGRAMVPVSILAEGLQIPVSWDRETRMVSLGRVVLLAGSSLDFPPFEYQEGSDIAGFDIDLIQAIEKELGEDIEIKDIRFDALIPSLRSGEVDLIISGLTIVEQRKKFMEFTAPYFDYGEIILVPKSSNKNIVMEDLAGKKIAFQSGSQAQEIVSDLAEKYPATQLSNYESQEEVWAAVEKGEADAAVIPHPPTAHYLTQHPESSLQMVGKVLSSQPQGIAVQKGNQELLEKLDKCLKTIKENGTYDRIYQKWFGSSCNI